MKQIERPLILEGIDPTGVQYRQQEVLLEPLGLWLSRPLLANLLRGSAAVLHPLVSAGLCELL